MRKRIVSEPSDKTTEAHNWLDLSTTMVEISSEDTDHPIERALLGEHDEGWRAAEPGPQRIRLIFERPQKLRRIALSFVEKTTARTQEFVLRWSSEDPPALREIVRQQWNFNPEGSSVEDESYEVDLSGATMLELSINPDISDRGAYASLRRLRLA